MYLNKSLHRFFCHSYKKNKIKKIKVYQWDEKLKNSLIWLVFVVCVVFFNFPGEYFIYLLATGVSPQCHYLSSMFVSQV